MKTLSVFMLSLACAASLAVSEQATAKRPPRAIEPALWDTAHFQRAHPDLKHRVAAQNHLEDGRFAKAREEFTAAAHWGDKLSQAMLAEMYWVGRGTDVDRARAYAWMDLAAEQRFVPFVAKRERYWAELTPAERERALQIGQEYYAAYGDDVAQARLDARLRKETRRVTGSRLGSPGFGSVILGTKGGSRVKFYSTSVQGQFGSFAPVNASGGNQISLQKYYVAELWRPHNYRQWQMDQLEFARRGIVEVGSSAQERSAGDGRL